jgi:hypothetical protein
MMAGVCVGTVNGLIFEASVLEQMSARVPHAEVLCAPEEVTIDQALRVVVAYIDTHPERMQERFPLLALLALTKEWPCHQ